MDHGRIYQLECNRKDVTNSPWNKRFTIKDGIRTEINPDGDEFQDYKKRLDSAYGQR